MEEVIKSNYSIRLELPSYVTVTQCQHLLDEISHHKIVKDAVFVIESDTYERRFISRKIAKEFDRQEPQVDVEGRSITL